MGSAVAEVIIVADPVVNIVADEYSICDGGTASLSSSVTDGSGASVYQWQLEIGSIWSDIDNAINATYSSPVLTEGTYTYRLLVTQATGCYTVSNVIIIDVVADPVLTISAVLNDFCAGGSAELHVDVTGGAGTDQYLSLIHI